MWKLEREAMPAECIDLMSRQQVRELAGKLMDAWQNLDAVAGVLGCPRNSIRRWYLASQHQNADGDKFTNMPGRPPKLSAIQQQVLQDIIFTKTPLDMNQQQALWSNLAIRNTIEDLFNIRLSLGTINTMTLRMGIARRNIFKSERTQRNSLIGAWLRNCFPSIRTSAKDRHARIFFIHDAALTPDPTRETSIWKDPLPRANDCDGPSNSGEGIISAICPRNSQRFMFFTDAFGKPPLIEFLKGLIHDFDQQLFLIAGSQYKSMALETDDFIASMKDRISLFFLPDKC